MILEKNNKNEYYVYAYLNPLKKGNFKYDYLTFDYEPFYIGKGKGCRKNAHLYKHSLKQKNSKNDIINYLLGKNLKPIIILLQKDLEGKKAYELEKKIVTLIGRKDLNNGPLTNLIDGGAGGCNYKYSNEARRKHQIKIEERKIKISKDTLYDLAITKKTHLNTIANMYNCSLGTIRNKLKLHNIKKPRFKRIVQPKIHRIILDTDELYNHYMVSNKTMKECAEIFNCSLRTIFNNTKNYGFLKGKNKQTFNIQKDELYKLHITENKNLDDCANHYGCSKGTICDYLKKYNISKIKIIQNSNNSKFNKDSLYDYLVKENHTMNETCLHFNCTKSFLESKIKEYSIIKINPNASKKHLITYEDLFRERIINKKTIFECSEFFGVSVPLISRVNKKYGILTTEIFKKNITREELYDVYITNNKTMKECYEFLDSTPKIIRTLLKKYNINKRIVKHKDNN